MESSPTRKETCFDEESSQNPWQMSVIYEPESAFENLVCISPEHWLPPETRPRQTGSFSFLVPSWPRTGHLDTAEAPLLHSLSQRPQWRHEANISG